MWLWYQHDAGLVKSLEVLPPRVFWKNSRKARVSSSVLSSFCWEVLVSDSFLLVMVCLDFGFFAIQPWQVVRFWELSDFVQVAQLAGA